MKQRKLLNLNYSEEYEEVLSKYLEIYEELRVHLLIWIDTFMERSTKDYSNNLIESKKSDLHIWENVLYQSLRGQLHEKTEEELNHCIKILASSINENDSRYSRELIELKLLFIFINKVKESRNNTNSK